MTVATRAALLVTLGLAIVVGCRPAFAVPGQRQNLTYLGRSATYTSPHWPYGAATFEGIYQFKRCALADSRFHLPNALASYTLEVGGEIASSTLPGSSIEGWVRFANSLISSWNIEAVTPDGTILHTCGPTACQQHVGAGKFAGDRASGPRGTYLATEPGGWIVSGCSE